MEVSQAFDWEELEKVEAHHQPKESELRTGLRKARPQWSQSELLAAERKLAGVGIRDAKALAVALEEELPEGPRVNRLLQQAGFRAFSAEALAALRLFFASPSTNTEPEPAQPEGNDALDAGFDDEPQGDLSDWAVVHGRVALRAAPSTQAEALGVLVRGRLVRGWHRQIAGEPWLCMRLSDALGGPMTENVLREWRIISPEVALCRTQDDSTKFKDIPQRAGPLLGWREGSWMRLGHKSGYVRIDRGGVAELQELPERMAWLLISGSSLGLGALLAPLDAALDETLAEPAETETGTQIRRVLGRGLSLFATKNFDQGVAVLEDRPFFRRPSFAQLKKYQKFFSKAFQKQYEKIKAPLTLPGHSEKVQSYVYASPSMLRSAVAFATSSRLVQQMILELHYPRLDLAHPIVCIAGEVAALCARTVPECAEVEEVLQRAILAIEMNIFTGESCFLTISRLNHSCFPNVVFVSDKRHFRSLQPIEAGQELLHSYLGRELLLPIELRRRHLWRSKCFQCACERCASQEDPLRAIACMRCAERRQRWEVVHSPGVWLRSTPSVEGPQKRFLKTGTRMKALLEMEDAPPAWIHVEVWSDPDSEECKDIGWVLTNGRNVVTGSINRMLCVQISEDGRQASDAFDGSAATWSPGRAFWDLASAMLLPPDEQHPVSPHEEQEEDAVTRQALEGIPRGLELPTAAFEGSDIPLAAFDGKSWRCSQCGQPPKNEEQLQSAERLLGRLAEKTFFSPSMTPALGSVQGGLPGGQNLKMVKRSFIRRALELATTASLVLGPQHWSVHWARLLVVDLYISRLSYAPMGARRVEVASGLLTGLEELWEWLASLGLAHDPSCFLLTRMQEALRLVGAGSGHLLPPEIQRKVRRLQSLMDNCEKQVDILPIRPLIIDGSSLIASEDEEDEAIWVMVFLKASPSGLGSWAWAAIRRSEACAQHHVLSLPRYLLPVMKLRLSASTVSPACAVGQRPATRLPEKKKHCASLC
ncbi:unnamed protein product [Symbiodinium natans]|uniref:SET domain-containing protein n=1 Tax=Symbiodinium natans TaxID=878477 RepID=A0A812KLI1_9DINO|nr:unnamed protein product [Symbiodinium natans]